MVQCGKMTPLAANSARDFFRTRGTAKRGGGATISLDTPSATILASLELAQDFDRSLLLASIEALLPADRREQIVFRLYYRQGLTAKEISSIPALDLSLKGVESMIFRITKQIRERLHDSEKRPGIAKSISKTASFRSSGK